MIIGGTHKPAVGGLKTPPGKAAFGTQSGWRCSSGGPAVQALWGGRTLGHFTVLFITPEDMSPGMSHTRMSARALTHTLVASQTGRLRTAV